MLVGLASLEWIDVIRLEVGKVRVRRVIIYPLSINCIVLRQFGRAMLDIFFT